MSKAENNNIYKNMAKKITKKAIKEVTERLNKVSTSPEERLKLLKEMNAFVIKTDKMVKELIAKANKESQK